MTTPFSVSPSELLARMNTGDAPVLLDVRRDAAFDASRQMIASAKRCAPQDVAAWGAANAALRSKDIVVYCVYGHNVSFDACQELRALGFNARALAGGIQGGEDGVDTASETALWRATTLPRQAK